MDALLRFQAVLAGERHAQLDGIARMNLLGRCGYLVYLQQPLTLRGFDFERDALDLQGVETGAQNRRQRGCDASGRLQRLSLIHI